MNQDCKISFLCDICKKEFKSKINLSTHQKTAKFCLKLRNDPSVNIINKCNYCNEEFKTDNYLNRHNDICKIRLRSIAENQTKLREENESKLKQESDRKDNEILILQGIANTLQKDNEYLLSLKSKYEEQIQSLMDENRKEIINKETIILNLESDLRREKAKSNFKSTTDYSDNFYKILLEKKDKMVDKLIQENFRLSELKREENNTVTNITINNYGNCRISDAVLQELIEDLSVKGKTTTHIVDANLDGFYIRDATNSSDEDSDNNSDEDSDY